MSTGTGLSAQLGIAEESTYGTYVEPDTFFEFTSESIVPANPAINSEALGGGVFRSRAPRHHVTGASGDVVLDVVNLGWELFIKHALGELATSQPDDMNEPNHYRHRGTPGALRGKSLTLQVGRPSTDGTIRPFSYTGGKITAWTLAAELDAIATLTQTFDFKTEDTTEDLATASYPSNLRSFTFLDGSLTMDGDTVAVVNSIELSGTNPMNTNRRGLGGEKLEPLVNGKRLITGTFTSEFENMLAHQAWMAGAEQADLLLTFALAGTEIDEGEENPFKLVIEIPRLYYTGDAPQVSGPDIVSQNKPFEAYKPASGEIITMDLHNDDSAA
jgi:hypothetical protein